MQRRRISINNVPINDRHLLVVEAKRRMRERFVDSEYLDKFLDILTRSGWTGLDIDSAVQQYSNTDRPAVQAFLFHNEHVLDQLLLTQGTYTHFSDTARDPNYALRHPGQAELIFRRMTPGDLLMLQAAQISSALLHDEDRPAHERMDYWRCVWVSMCRLVIGDSKPELLVNPLLALASVLDYVLTTCESDTGEPVCMEDLNNTFMQPDGRFYVGLSVSRETVRKGDRFQSCYIVCNVQHEDESIWMASCVLLAYAIDNDARAVMLGDRRLRRDGDFYDGYRRTVKRGDFTDIGIYSGHGNQETQDHPRPVATSRLLP